MFAGPARLLTATAAIAILAAAAPVGWSASALASTASTASTAATTVASSTTNGDAGLFGAQDPTYDGVYRQGLAILGLVAAGRTADAAAVSWLLAQQCADGGFTSYRANTATACVAGQEDENATALAIEALAALGKPTSSAIAALKHFQLVDGGFYESAVFGTPASDVDSTGLALSAFAAVGVDPATVVSSAGKTADDFLRSVQLSCAATTGPGGYDYQPEATLHANDLATAQAALGELGKTFPVAAGSTQVVAPTCPASISDAGSSAAAALSYLTARLTATSGAIPSSLGSGTDWTSTAWAAIDLLADGAGTTGGAVGAALGTLQANAKVISQASGIYTAGATATLLLTAHAAGIDPTAFGGLNLVSALQGTERTAAPAPSPTSTPTSKRTAPATAPVLPMTGGAHITPLGAVGALLVALGLLAVLTTRVLATRRPAWARRRP